MHKVRPASPLRPALPRAWRRSWTTPRHPHIHARRISGRPADGAGVTR